MYTLIFGVVWTTKHKLNDLLSTKTQIINNHRLISTHGPQASIHSLLTALSSSLESPAPKLMEPEMVRDSPGRELKRM